MKKNKLFSIFIFISALSLAFSWFNEPKKEDKPSNKKTTSQAGSSATSVPSREVAPPANIPQVYKPPQVVQAPKVYKPATPAVNTTPTHDLAAARAIKDTVDVVKVHKQIQEIIDLNEALKTQYQAQAAQIQRVVEQARIRQRILSDLEKSKKEQSLTAKDEAEILRQEKIRVIRDETEKDKKFIQDLKSDVSSPKTSTPARAKAS